MPRYVARIHDLQRWLRARIEQRSISAVDHPATWWQCDNMHHKAPITTINVSGLPQPIVRFLSSLVRGLQRLPRTSRKDGAFLYSRPGKVKEPINRDHLYEDAG